MESEHGADREGGAKMEASSRRETTGRGRGEAGRWDWSPLSRLCVSASVRIPTAQIITLANFPVSSAKELILNF